MRSRDHHSSYNTAPEAGTGRTADKLSFAAGSCTETEYSSGKLALFDKTGRCFDRTKLTRPFCALDCSEMVDGLS